MQNENTGTKHLFQSVLYLPDSLLANTNFIYELQRLAEKPAIKFSDASHFEQKMARGFTIMKVTPKNKEIKGSQNFEIGHVT